MKKIISILMAMVSMLGFAGCKSQNSTPADDAAERAVMVISVNEFQAALAADSAAVLLDVRRPDEFAAGHLAGAQLLNWLDEAAFATGAKSLDKGKTIYVYCRSGRRSNAAAHYLAKRGYRVIDMDGGYMAWSGAGLPTTTE